ncbi:MAG TPA: hypothetical protein VME69_03730 [Methylocella sp.]|nr:hypothetical protein [Methylocella sp.]
MIRLILIGMWASLITITSSYGVTYFRQMQAKKAAAAASSTLETRKTKEINVPKVRDGAVKGYVVMQFSYVIDVALLKSPSVSPDAFVVDEAFRYIYDDDSIDFRHLEKVDLHALAATVVMNVNARLKAEILKDIAFDEFTFMPSRESPM